ncbi:nucleotidyltransferase [Streptomyces gilvifuscus]|uniref:Nucleotidyltransferase n=1 Tax=Streptomyces gilvifuscus TaxID=1550617 RepID=A0ABT5G054_9ACTN|nr:nucleotidyltransferase [Streptomyces gilvifuscus]MDC2958158.1 nucleotidyltransferase [Streptomyces gilvifuscus]
MDWEQWLRQSVKRPSDHEDGKRERTEEQIRAALRAHEPLRDRDYVVYAKGSYANNTNVRLDYDVDVAVEYKGYFYYDLEFDLKDQPKSAVDIVDSTDSYTRNEFKRDIQDALVEAFGESAVNPGRIALRVREKKTTLPADIVPCWEYRRYDRIENGVPVYHQGTRVYPSSGDHINNYPAQQLENGTNKNNRTKRRYKRMVRALKRLQTRLIESGTLTDELPSYLIECLVYNVPDGDFGHPTYKADMRAVLAFIFNGTLPSGDWNDWEEVNGLKYLFRGNPSWTHEQVHDLADAAWDEIGFE